MTTLGSMFKGGKIPPASVAVQLTQTLDIPSLVPFLVASLYADPATEAFALGTPNGVTAALLAWTNQDDDAHDTCSLTACLNPLHPGPCKGWKSALHDVSPGAWHALEAARVEKANHRRMAKIEALKSAGKPIPHKLLQPILPKTHPNAGKTAAKASGDAHIAGQEVSANAGVHVSEPGKVTLGQAIKPIPQNAGEKGPKGKKPTLASKGIAFIIGQEKVTPQYKLDKAAAITPEQWAGLSEADQASIRGELTKIKADGFGPQQKKADELLAKLPAGAQPHEPSAVEKAQAANAAHHKATYEALAKAAPLKLPEPEAPKATATRGDTAPHHVPKTPGEPLSAKNHTPAMKDATDAAAAYANPPKIHALQTTFSDRFKAYQKVNAEEWKALPEGTKTTIIKDMIDSVAGDKQLHQGFIGDDGKAYTPVSAWMTRRNIQVPALDQGKIDKYVPLFAKDKPTKPAPIVHIPEKTTVESKNIFGEHSQVTKVTHPKYEAATKATEAAPPKLSEIATPDTAVTTGGKLSDALKKAAPEAKPKPLPKHVEHAIAMANGQAPGASWSKNHLAAYQPLSAEEFHALPKDVQDKIVSELTKGQSKFLDPKKIQASKDLLAKFGKGSPGAPKVEAPKVETPVGFHTHAHDHSVTQAQAKEAVAKAPISSHFELAKQVAGLTSEDNPDDGNHVVNAIDHAKFIVEQKTKLYDKALLDKPAVKLAMSNLDTAAMKQSYATSVLDAKSKAHNKITKALGPNGSGMEGLSPIEKASLLHYQKHLLNHHTDTSTAEIDKLTADKKAAGDALDAALHAALKQANAPKPQDMSAAQIEDRAKELLGAEAAHVPHLSLTDTHNSKKVGLHQADLEAAKYPPGVVTDPAVAAKHQELANAAAQVQNNEAIQQKLVGHVGKHHMAALNTGLDVSKNNLSPDDVKVLGLHAKQLSEGLLPPGTLAKAKEKLDAAKQEYHAAAKKAEGSLKPAEPYKLSSFDQAAIADAYSGAWGKHASKAAAYGVNTLSATQAMKTHPDYLSLTQDLGNLKALAGKVALAHAEEHAANLNVPLDPETGAMLKGPEHQAWLDAVKQRSDLESQFNALHKTTQAKLDKVRTDAGLKKRALPKLESPAVKASAAESGYYKSGSYSGPNYGKAASAKQYMLAKVGPKIGVAHQTPSEKKLAKLGDVAAGKGASTSKIENVPSGEPVKLGGADTSIAHLPDSLKKQITSDFKGMPTGKYLADPTEDIFGNLVNLAAAHGKNIPGGLSVDHVLKTIDETHSKNLGVANGGMLHKKVTDWLGTAAGKQYAEHHSTPDPKVVKQLNGELDLPEGVTLAPGEKVQKLAGPGSYDESLHADAFKPLKAHEAQAAQDEWMKANGVKWSAQQKAALTSYTGSAYSTYNSYLRGDGPGSQDTKQKVINIQSAMMPLPQHTLLKRGTGWPPELSSFEGNPDGLLGKTFEDKAFVSTTVAGSSGHFSGHALQLVIEAPKGTPAAFVNSLSHFKDKENEMLLAAGTKFKVLSVEKTTGGHTLLRVRIVGSK